MASKKRSQHRAKPSKRNKEHRVSNCVLIQPMHGGDTSMWPSKFLIKSGLIPIVKPTLSGETHIIANYLYHATMIIFCFTLNSQHFDFDKHYNQVIVKVYICIINICISITLESIICKSIYVEINIGVYAFDLQSIALLMAIHTNLVLND